MLLQLRRVFLKDIGYLIIHAGPLHDDVAVLREDIICPAADRSEAEQGDLNFLHIVCTILSVHSYT